MFLPFEADGPGEVRKEDLSDDHRELVRILYADQPYEADCLPYTDEGENMAGTFAARTGIPIMLGDFCRIAVSLRKDGFLPRKFHDHSNPWRVLLSNLTDSQKQLIRDLYDKQTVVADRLPYTRELEWMVQQYQAQTGTILPMGNYFWLILSLRKEKSGGLPPKGRKAS